jgi:selenocysteine lyase/cysteine desulfurase
MTDFRSVQQREYPWMTDSDVVYLDHASTGAIPKSAVDAMSEYLSAVAAIA